MKIIRAVIIGAGGSGKGTISDKILQAFHIEHLSTGNILRNNVANGTELGKKVQNFLSSGSLVPDNLMTSLVFNELETRKSVSCLLDGYPRTVIQAESLWKQTPVDLVIHLVVPINIIMDRLSNRWTHLPSGRVYNYGFKDPIEPGLDDITKEKLVQRDDDKPEVVKKRLDNYQQTIIPILQFYKKKRVLNDFKGDTSAEIWDKLYPFLCTQLPKKEK